MTTRPGGLYNQRRSTEPSDAPQTLVGRVLDGRFRLDEVLNVGGMGMIFVATQLSVGRKVAVKILKPTLSDEQDLNLRFQQEVELVASLSHPNIVSMIDAGHDVSGLNYLVMEFVDGLTFREALKASSLPLADILQIFILTCDALIEAHSLDIIHRDLKFDNIMLKRQRDRRLHVQVLDFGVAKILSRDANLTRGGQVPGTPGIIAPELVSNQSPSPQSDLYSMGILLYTTLTGSPPFEGINDLELMRAHQFEPVPPMEPLIQPYVPEALVELTYTLLEKLPQNRPESARDLRHRLENIRSLLLESLPDLPAYMPPHMEQERDQYGSGAHRLVSVSGVKELVPPSGVDRSQQFTSDFLEEEREEEAEERPFIVVPASIVSALVLVLMVLLLIIFVLIRRLFVEP